MIVSRASDPQCRLQRHFLASTPRAEFSCLALRIWDNPGGPRVRSSTGDAPMPGSASDRNLLFGILDLQMDFISRDQLVAAMYAWVPGSRRSTEPMLP